jgi:hypothetical protein
MNNKDIIEKYIKTTELVLDNTSGQSIQSEINKIISIKKKINTKKYPTAELIRLRGIVNDLERNIISKIQS